MIQSIQDKSLPEELIVRDADGNFKVLRNGRLEEWGGGASRANAAAHSGEHSPLAPPAIRTPAVPASSARFYMDVSDEEEIEHFRTAHDGARAQQVNAFALACAKRVIASSGLAVSPEAMPRLERAVVSRLKDVRDLHETKEVLTRARNLGGIGIEGAAAQALMKRIEEARTAFEEEVKVGKFEIPKSKSQIISNDQFQISKPATVRTPERAGGTVVPLPTIPALSIPPVRPFVHPSYSASELKTQNSKLKTKEEDTGISSPVSTSNFQLPTSPVRPHVERGAFQEPRSALMQEVRVKPKLMGPVDELRQLTLEDFKRLAPTAQTAADKVREKVELLADESLVKRGEGVLAWKSSPVHQLYLTLGRESMEKKQSVKAVIDDWQKRNRPMLTAEEFDAIADLNQKLAY